MPYLIGTTLDSGRIPTKKAVTTPKPSTWLTIPTAPGMRALPGSRPQPRMADEEDALGRRRYIDKVYAGLVSPRPEVQRAVGEQYDYNKKRALAGKKPLEIADTRWNPTAYDDDTNEALEAWYKQHRSLPGPGEQSEFDYMSREFRNQKAARERRDAAPASMSAARPADDERAREITQGWKDAMAQRKAEEAAAHPLGGGGGGGGNTLIKRPFWQELMLKQNENNGRLLEDIGIDHETQKKHAQAARDIVDAITKSPASAFAGGAVNSLTWGYPDISNRLTAKILRRQGVPDYVSPTAELDEVRNEHPVANAMGELAGSVASGMALERLGVSLLSKAFPALTSKLARGVISGGAAGGVQNALLSVGDGADPAQVAQDFLFGLAMGSAGDAGFRMVSDLAGGYIPKVGTKLYDEWLKNGLLLQRLQSAAKDLGVAITSLLDGKADIAPSTPVTETSASQPMENLLKGEITPEQWGLDDALARQAEELDKVAGGPGADYTGGNGTDLPSSDGHVQSSMQGTGQIFTSTPELEFHIRNVDPSTPRSRGIGGAHSSEAFFNNDVNIVLSRPSKDIQGITYYEYTMPLLGKDGKPLGGYGSTIFRKTVYDPNLFSDSDYMRRGLEAAHNSYRANGVLDDAWEGYDSYGVKWIGYGKDGQPTSFFPEVP